MKENTNTTRSLLARLLAKENITVQHGNFSTAFFDVKNRLLGLPIWKDKGKDVYDLLVGHEVGHALYTPLFDPKKFKAPHAYVNVVEDIRIERMIQSTYPGLVRAFRSGYATLAAEDFFGISGKNLSKLGLPDRINLKAKIGTIVDIPFTAAEAKIVKQCFDVVTWDDTLKAAEALAKFCRAQKEDDQDQSGGEQAFQKKQQKSKNKSSSDGSDEKSEKSEKTEDRSKGPSDSSDEESESEEESESDSSGSSESKSYDDSNEDGDESESAGSDGDDSDESGEEDSQSQTSGSKSGVEPMTSSQLPEVTTANQFDKKARDLIDASKEVQSTAYLVEPTEKEAMAQIIPYSKVFEGRNQIKEYVNATQNPNLHRAFSEFMSSTNKHVAVLKKEFDLRKAAYQYSRATVARSGILNVDKLHNYRIDDDIFLSVTQLANAKNHGMVLFVDYSSSMSIVLPHILKHLINLIVFCKSVGIPYRVYGFTCDTGYFPSQWNARKDVEGRITLGHLALIELSSSEMTKSDYHRSIRDLYIRCDYYAAHGKNENLGSTPLCEALVAAHKIVRKFQADTHVQKVVTMFLTDGEGQRMNTERNLSYDVNRGTQNHYGANEFQITLNGRKIRSSFSPDETTNALIANLKITTGCKMIGFFVPSSIHSAKEYVRRARASLKVIDTNAKLETSMSSFKKDKVVCTSGAYNYDEYFVVSSGKDLAVEDDDLEIDADMARGAMIRAFNDFSKSKRTNRVFVTKFAEAIA